MYYKLLELDSWQAVSNRLNSYVDQHPELIKAQNSPWVNSNTQEVLTTIPELQDLFRPLNLTIARISFFIMWTNACEIHVDDTVCNARINIPVRNCTNTWTKFFTPPSSTIRKYQPNGVSYMHIEGPFTEVDKFELIGPVVFKPKEPHQVIMDHNNFPRISVTIAFNEDPSSLITTK
jgi:hypothetical protein